MEEDIVNYSTTVMLHGTPCMFNNQRRPSIRIATVMFRGTH